MSDEALMGEIVFARPERGFFFVKRDDGEGNDVFLHIRDVLPHRRYSELAIGQRVRFELGKNPNNGRTCAVNVELVEPILSQEAVPFQRDAGDAGDDEFSPAFMRR
jgi:cold shock CspA family protein